MKRFISIPCTWRLAVISMITIIVFVLMLFNVAAVHAEGQTAPPAFAAGDIQFCPKGKPYLHSSCSDLRTKMQDAITDARNAAAAGISGTIYIEDGTYSNTTNDATGGSINIEGFTYGTDLIIQGGVNSGSTTFLRELFIADNEGPDNSNGLDLTLVDVSLSSSISGDDGMRADSNIGNITLRDVIASTNTDFGLVIMNHTGNISLQDVNVNNNGSRGIHVTDVTGKATLQNVTANHNTYSNIHLVNISGDITLNTITANDSTSGEGIDINTCGGKKGVTLNNITTNNNHADNIYISAITQNITLNGVIADGAGAKGIWISNIHGSKGVTLNNVTASGNNSNNIQLNTIDGNATLTGITANNSLSGDGINFELINGKKGITLKEVTANGNFSNNIYAYDIDGNAAFTNVTANSTFSNEGIFLEYVNSTKGVTMKDVIASENNDTNIRLSSIAGNVSLTDIVAEHSAAGSGIVINNTDGTKGVTMKNITANTNDDENIFVSETVGNITFTSVEANESVTSHGIYLLGIQGSKGATLKKISADNNYAKNVYLNIVTGASLTDISANNSTNDDGIHLFTINGTKGITLKNIIADGNHGKNIYAGLITGNASLNNTQANSSTDEQGIYLESVAGEKGITIKGAVADDNHLENLYIENIAGNVSLNVIETLNSTLQEGILLHNISGTKGVTLKQVTSENNFIDNLYLDTITGDVNLTEIQANDSQNLNGIYIGFVSGSKGVSLKNITANTNDLNNIQIQYINPGNVVFNNVQGTGCDTGSGLYVNILAGSLFGVNGTFSGNANFGIFTDGISGLIALKTIVADNNGIHGAKLASTTNQLVCSSQFNNNTSRSMESSTTNNSLTLSAVLMTGNGINDPLLNFTTLFISTKCVVIPPAVP